MAFSFVEDVMPNAGDTSTETMDLDAAVDRIGASVFGPMSEPNESPGLNDSTDSAAAAHEAAQPEAPPPPAPKTYDPPKSWKKEMHEHWTKLDPIVQGYFVEREEQLLNGFKQFSPLRDALQPHLDYLNQHNIQAPYAIDSLLRAHRMLTEGPIEQRRAYYDQLGKNLKIIEATAAAQAPPAAPVDPMLQQLQQQVSNLESTIQARHQRELETVKTEVQKEVDLFASDTKAHPYFDEVATDIAAFVSQGKSLQDAYDMAVWANPVTRGKEQARLLTEHEAKLKENARLAALPKKKAAGVNVRSSGEGTAPTEPVGSLEDTIRSVNRAIRNRAS
jgi:hypothetical protein